MPFGGSPVRDYSSFDVGLKMFKKIVQVTYTGRFQLEGGIFRAGRNFSFSQLSVSRMELIRKDKEKFRSRTKLPH
jgi:hypothetical protein